MSLSNRPTLLDFRGAPPNLPPSSPAISPFPSTLPFPSLPNPPSKSITSPAPPGYKEGRTSKQRRRLTEAEKTELLLAAVTDVSLSFYLSCTGWASVPPCHIWPSPDQQRLHPGQPPDSLPFSSPLFPLQLFSIGYSSFLLVILTCQICRRSMNFNAVRVLGVRFWNGGILHSFVMISSKSYDFLILLRFPTVRCSDRELPFRAQFSDTFFGQKRKRRNFLIFFIPLNN